MGGAFLKLDHLLPEMKGLSGINGDDIIVDLILRVSRLENEVSILKTQLETSFNQAEKLPQENYEHPAQNSSFVLKI